jgi:hypothetical protein
MAEVLEFYTQKVTDDPEQREHWQRCRLEAATRLAKYQSSYRLKGRNMVS